MKGTKPRDPKIECDVMSLRDLDWSGLKITVMIALLAGEESDGKKFEQHVYNAALKACSPIMEEPYYVKAMVAMSILLGINEEVQKVLRSSGFEPKKDWVV